MTIRDKVERMLREFRVDVYDGKQIELCFDEELFEKWLNDNIHLIEEDDNI